MSRAARHDGVGWLLSRAGRRGQVTARPLGESGGRFIPRLNRWVQVVVVRLVAGIGPGDAVATDPCPTIQVNAQDYGRCPLHSDATP